MTKFESGVKVVPASQEAVYEKLSNLSNLEKVKDRLPEDKVKNLSFDAESMTIEVAPVGKITLQIVEKEPCKCIKFATTTSPLPFNLWIQIVPVTETECKMKLTIGMDISSTGVSPISSAFFNRSGVQKASYSRFMRRINLSADIFQ